MSLGSTIASSSACRTGEPPIEESARVVGRELPSTAVITVQEVGALDHELTRFLQSSAAAHQVALAPSFLRAYLGAPPDGVQPSLLVARMTDATVVGVSAFARFDVRMDCLAPRAIQNASASVRALWSRFLRTRVVMFGLPCGLGGFETAISAPDTHVAERARTELIRRSTEICERERAAAVIWKELDASLCATWDAPLAQAGFLRERSVPTVAQEMRFSSVADYEAALRANYRHQLRTNVRSAAAAGLIVKLAEPLAPRVGSWYPLFEQVLDHSTTRLETLDPGFFARLAADPRYVLNTAERNGKLVGGAVCTVKAGVLHFLYVGMEYAAARHCDLYFNLLHSVLRLAIERGCKEIHWGQTSLDAKGRFGGVAQPLWFYLRFRRSALQSAMRTACPFLFPERRQTRRHVLRSGGDGS